MLQGAAEAGASFGSLQARGLVASKPLCTVAAGADESEILTICLLGGTGAGKSSLGNSILGSRGDDTFYVDEASALSVTSTVDVREGPWRGSGPRPVRCVDTPGFQDAQGREQHNLESIAEALKKAVCYVHLFALVFNGQEERFNSGMREMLVVLKCMFGLAFLKNVVLVFTRWENDKKERKKRARSGLTEVHRARTINAELRRALGHDFECPCIFVDNTLNKCSDEFLEDIYDDELESLRQEFDSELEKLMVFMLRARPFRCQAVAAVELEKERLKKEVRRLMSFVDEARLGRNVIVTEQSVIHRGWLRWEWKRVWAVLRRQSLRLFEDDVCSKLVAEEIDLSGCICSSGSDWGRFHGFPSFTIYKPASVQVRDAYFRHAFYVSSEAECKEWVLLTQEATQISESCHRIERFHESLSNATTFAEYRRAVAMVDDETMVIPVEWALQRADPEGMTGRVPDLEQALKDIKRETVEVDKEVFTSPGGEDSDCSADDLAAYLVSRILQGARHPEDDNADVKAAVLARDVLMTCSRTRGGGDTYFTVKLLFDNDGLVVCKPETPTDRVTVKAQVLQTADEQNHLLRDIGPDTGVPQFQKDTSAANLSMELVRCMDKEGDQVWCTNRIGREEWVPDAHMVVCMRCGHRFNPFSLRRHHCRACAALVCYYCSRHFVSVAAPAKDGRRGVKEPPYNSGSSTSSVMSATHSTQKERVCFLCYQKEVIKDLDMRKTRGNSVVLQDALPPGQDSGSFSEESSKDALPPGQDPGSVHEESSKDPDTGNEAGNTADERGKGAVVCQEPAASEANAAPAAGDAAATRWPAIMVETASKFTILSAELLEPAFTLTCRYVRIIRWSGLADEGRILITVRPVA